MTHLFPRSGKMLSCLLVAGALSGCATVDQRPKTAVLWHKTGATIFTKQRALDQCKVASFRTIPQVMAHQSYGGSFDPGRTECNDLSGKMSCNTWGAHYSPPRIYSYDVNQRLRNELVAQCFIDKGYRPVRKRYCEDGLVGYSNKEPAPPLSKIVCLDRKRTLLLDE